MTPLSKYELASLRDVRDGLERELEAARVAVGSDRSTRSRAWIGSRRRRLAVIERLYSALGGGMTQDEKLAKTRFDELTRAQKLAVASRDDRACARHLDDLDASVRVLVVQRCDRYASRRKG